MFTPTQERRRVCVSVKAQVASSFLSRVVGSGTNLVRIVPDSYQGVTLVALERYFREEGYAVKRVDDDPYDMVISNSTVENMGVIAVGYAHETPSWLFPYRATAVCFEGCIIASVRFNGRGGAFIEVDTAENLVSRSLLTEEVDRLPAPKLSDDPGAFVARVILSQAELVLRQGHYRVLEKNPTPDFDFLVEEGATGKRHLVCVAVCSNPHDEGSVYAITDTLPRDSTGEEALIFKTILHFNAKTSWRLRPLCAYPLPHERA